MPDPRPDDAARLADELEIDVMAAARAKPAAARARYPAEETRGVAPEKA